MDGDAVPGLAKLVTVTILAVIAAGCSRGAESLRAAPTTTAVSSVAATVPVAAPVTSSPVVTKADWFHRYGRDLTDVADSIKVIGSSFATRDPHDVATSCHDLVRQLQVVASHPAIPDGQTMALYASALAIVAPTSAACQADATLPAASDRAKVEPEFEAYVGRLSAIQDALSAP